VTAAAFRREPTWARPTRPSSVGHQIIVRPSPNERSLQLPHRASAHVPIRKVRDYLLSTSHPDGRSKARYFVSRGYDPASPWRLAADLRAIADVGEVSAVRDTEWGPIYEVEGAIDAPDGALMRLATVWIIGPDTIPRLITAYPARHP
jgi:hypothetical protein